MGITVRRAATLALVLMTAAFAGGCGGDDDGGEPAGGGEAAAEVAVTAVEASDGLGFDPSELTAAAGSVTITMDNPDGNELPHTVAIDGVETENAPVGAGESATVIADLEAGTYTFYCPVGDHRQNGMEGTLTVE